MWVINWPLAVSYHFLFLGVLTSFLVAYSTLKTIKLPVIASEVKLSKYHMFGYKLFLPYAVFGSSGRKGKYGRLRGGH